MMKKLLSVCLALVMLLSMTVAMADEKIELHWYYVGNGIQKDTELVNQKVNELLHTYPGLENVDLVLHPVLNNEMKQQYTLAMASGDPIDIVNTYNTFVFADEVADGNLLPMDEYTASMDAIKATLPEWLLTYGQIDGKQYMIPSYQQGAQLRVMAFPTEYAQYMDLEKVGAMLLSKEMTPAEKAAVLEEALLAIRAGTGVETKYAQSMSNNYEATTSMGDVIESITGQFGYNTVTKKVVHMALTEEMKACYAVNADWYTRGIIHPEYLTINRATLNNANLINEESFFWGGGQGIGSLEAREASYEASWGFDVTVLPMADTYYIPAAYGAGGNAIHKTSKHPAEAMRVIELMTTEEGKELYNMIVYGIEGVHYEKTGDNTIRTFDYDGTQGGTGTPYSAYKWIIGNTFNAYLNQGCVEGLNEYILEHVHGDLAVYSDLLGFIPDTRNVETELAQCAAVMSEYNKPLGSGVMGEDFEAYYQEFATKMEQAGAQKVIDELQKQVDAFLANK